MKNLSHLLPASLLVLAVSCTSPVEERLHNQGVNVTPKPVELSLGEGFFALNADVCFVSPDEDAAKVATFFAAKIARSTGYELAVKDEQPAEAYINLRIESELPVNEEGYLLSVTPQFVDLCAKTPAGLFYAMQTVMQLLPAEIESSTLVKGVNWHIPVVEVKDEPRFSYRGMHLDVCRHFVDVEFIKKQLDVLALFKINKFHWHLTDDQAWRIEIKKYPRLTTVGATRIEGEGNTYGPYFFTQEDVKEVVRYAKERFIEVIPEIELPGHAVAAIAAYPELSCTGKEIPVRNIWGIANDVFCAGNEQVFTFWEDVFAEIVPLFESKFIHIGGDECPKGRWKACPKCQARIRKLGLKADKEHTAEQKLQSYCVQRMEKFLVARGKQIIGWDEILEGGLAPTATVMSWRGEQGGIASANMGHDVIMAPQNWFYLDRYQGDSKIQPVTIGGLSLLSKVYGYEPVPEAIEEDRRHHILGAQANVWTEYKYEGSNMEHDIYPRIIALAELNWTPANLKDYPDFERRIDNQRVRLDMHNINYYIPLPQQKGVPSCNFVAFTDRVTLEFETTEPARIVYTTDGSDPDHSSATYTTPLSFEADATLKLRSILLSEKMSKVRTITIEKQTPAPAVEKPADAPKGLEAKYYKGYHRAMAELEGRTPDATEIVDLPQHAAHRVRNYREVYEEDFYTTVLTGYIHIPADGVYYFSTDSELWLDGNLFISNLNDNQGTALRFSRSDRSVALAKGWHPIQIARMGAIFGGWPTQWEDINLTVRAEGEAEFKRPTAEWF